MSYPNNKSKEFKADRFKQYLITRSVSAKMAADLCLAGKIELKEIPIYTDKFTLLHFGQIQVEPEVDREILRISALDKKRREDEKIRLESLPGAIKSRFTPEVNSHISDHAPILCETCGHGKEGTDECSDKGMTECSDYNPSSPEPTDEDAEAELKRKEYEDEQQRAEDEANDIAKPVSYHGEKPEKYKCGICAKTYKNKTNCITHIKKKHSEEKK